MLLIFGGVADNREWAVSKYFSRSIKLVLCTASNKHCTESPRRISFFFELKDERCAQGLQATMSACCVRRAATACSGHGYVHAIGMCVPVYVNASVVGGLC